MDFQNIITAISTVGFPIVCCLCLFYFWNKEREQHREEMNDLKDAINNNSLVMQKLIDKLDSDNLEK